jgi:hypothetical protein
MESTEAEVKVREVWVFQTSVRAIFQREEEWWVQLEGSRESLKIGPRPAWNVGDKVKVTMEKIDAVS